MKFIDVNTKSELECFYKTGNQVYNQNPYYRSSEDDILELVVNGQSHFHSHAKVFPIIVMQDDVSVCRFAFIYDTRLPEYVQVAFFEAIEGLTGIADKIIVEAKKRFPNVPKICFGLNGHLNYGAGILLNNFDRTPVFGLPYSLSYYQDYFNHLKIRKIVSYSFLAHSSDHYKKLASRIKIDSSIIIKKLDRTNLQEYSKIYTQLNNSCFKNHPFWADRDDIEDLELFESFRHLLKNENLIFAEYNGKPVGFLLWFPDFNQLLKRNRQLKASNKFGYDVLRYKFCNPIKTFRFTEIAVEPDFRKKGVEMALINQMIHDVIAGGYKFGAGGFIFEENIDSINMALKYIERVTGAKMQQDNEYAVFETTLK